MLPTKPVLGYMCCAILQIHDWILALAVLALVIIDVVIIGMYTLVEDSRGLLVVEKVLNREHPQDTIGVSRCSSGCL